MWKLATVDLGKMSDTRFNMEDGAQITNLDRYLSNKCSPYVTKENTTHLVLLTEEEFIKLKEQSNE